MSEAQTVQADPTECGTCHRPLTNGYTTTYREVGDGFQPVAYTCDECEEERVFNEFVEHDYLCAKLLLNHVVGVYRPNLTKKGQRKRTSRRDYKTDKDRLFNERLASVLLQIQVAVKEFEGKVWFDAGLGQFLHDHTAAGLSGKWKEWTGRRKRDDGGYDVTYSGLEGDVRCFTTGGRSVITFEVTKRDSIARDHDGKRQPVVGTQITLITADSMPLRHCMGEQSVNGTVDDVLRLFSTVTYNWGEGSNPLLGEEPMKWDERLTPDKNVSII